MAKGEEKTNSKSSNSFPERNEHRSTTRETTEVPECSTFAQMR
eukprot:CAMPEP_0195300120 /NCGR_PEP_ID=MMETSP0707-20130614/26783_1 /TAXON_ID=33640 /ORGANISM="Asterionellopsis glacialis, Strain CCMP134" /LENGTH=42 /DNA_ID= /DNA_START= /DNA_END= /DNA_ORIENTATION=